MKLPAAAFDPRQFERNRKHSCDLLAGENLELPVLLARGRNPGGTLVATASVHGDEYEGVRAILEVFEALETGEMSGDFLAVPVANPPAFWAGTRTSPLDGANLARVFPGDADGSPSARIAYHLANSVIARADLYLDLHSAGIRWLMPSMVGFDGADPRSRAAAEVFGAEVVWEHPSVSHGRTVSFASERGIPWLYTEARGAGRIHPDDLAFMKRGLVNLMRHLGILPGSPEGPPIRVRLEGEGDTDRSLSATQAGFLLLDVDVLDRVRQGQRLGRLVDVHGRTLETYVAPEDGVLGMVRQFPVIEPGEPLFLLAQVMGGQAGEGRL